MKPTELRYHLILDESPETGRQYWNRPLYSSDKLIDLRCDGLNRDQPWHVLDTRTNRVLTQEEFFAIRAKIRG